MDRSAVLRHLTSLRLLPKPPKKHSALMGFIQRIAKRMPSSPHLPSLDHVSNEKGFIIPKFAFFRRRIRLRRNSAISIPLGFVLLFPCIVIVLIVLLIVTHPSSTGRILMPAGAPPSIRLVFHPPFYDFVIRVPQS